MTASRAYKYRLYPDPEQETLLRKTFGCVRFVFNRCLYEQERLHGAGEKYRGRIDMNAFCNHTLKSEYPFLREVDKFALTNAIWHLDAGYRRFFHGKAGHPVYKSRHRDPGSYTTNYTNGNIAVLDRGIKLPKLGVVRAVIHRRAPENYVLKAATVSRERDDTCYVSVLYEYAEEITPCEGTEAVGLDYKSDGLFTDSEGAVADMPHYYREGQEALAKAQRKLKNKVKGSANWKKQQKRIAKKHRHIANQRKDYLHKKSAGTANRYDIVCVEDLDMRAMAGKGFGNGKATLDNGYGMFIRMLEYKLHDRGKTLVRVDRWFPSSQICSRCGERKEMPLTERTYRCPGCGSVIDRDLNAAVNIRDEGLRMLLPA